MNTITTITLTHNEEEDIEICLKALSWADERLVLDSYSTDKVAQIARPLCERFIERRFEDFSSSRNFAISEAKSNWVLIIDADEIVTPELANEIRKVIKSSKFNAYCMNRINYVYGARLKYDQPDYTIRLFKKDKCHYENTIHEIPVVDGPIGQLKNSFFHYSMKNLDEHIKKINSYTTLEAERSKKVNFIAFIRPFHRLLEYIFIKKSWRDGVIGIIMCLNAVFYEFITLFKLWEKDLKS